MKEAKYITWDYEPYVHGPVTNSCFCRECIASFAKKYNLPENLTGNEILKKHKRAWVDFRCRQRADSVRKVVEVVKKINPKANFGFIGIPSAPGDQEEYEEKYGIRPTLYDDFVDSFWNMNYSASLNFFHSIERDSLELKKPKYTLVNTGWNRPDVPVGRRTMQYLAAVFCADDADFPGIAQGLFVCNGELVLTTNQVKDIERMAESLMISQANVIGTIVL